MWSAPPREYMAVLQMSTYCKKINKKKNLKCKSLLNPKINIRKYLFERKKYVYSARMHFYFKHAVLCTSYSAKNSGEKKEFPQKY